MIVTFVFKVDDVRTGELQEVLRSISTQIARDDGSPFCNIRELHFASAVVFSPPDGPQLLVLEHNFDGGMDSYLDSLTRHAGAELGRVIDCCADRDKCRSTDPDTLKRYLLEHLKTPAAFHVGNFWRTRTRIEAEFALVRDVQTDLDEWRVHNPEGTPAEAANAIRAAARKSRHFQDVRALAVAPSLWERVRPYVHIAIFVVLILLAFSVIVAILSRVLGSTWYAIAITTIVTIALAAGALYKLRSLERIDKAMPPTALTHEHVRGLTEIEDLLAQNHLASLTEIKTGAFRLYLLKVVLFVANLIARTSTSGTLSGIPSIHFAHWSILEDKWLLFLSNFDGSWGSYLDDFVDKASRGLTGIWTNTVGFPQTRFLILDGARDGVAFKAFARQMQTRAAFWYVASPYRRMGLTVERINTNTKLCEGLLNDPSTQAQLVSWLRRW